jgi:hypothetical protein
MEKAFSSLFLVTRPMPKENVIPVKSCCDALLPFLPENFVKNCNVTTLVEVQASLPILAGFQNNSQQPPSEILFKGNITGTRSPNARTGHQTIQHNLSQSLRMT